MWGLTLTWAQMRSLAKIILYLSSGVKFPAGLPECRTQGVVCEGADGLSRGGLQVGSEGGSEGESQGGSQGASQGGSHRGHGEGPKERDRLACTVHV